MSMIACAECSTPVSDQAPACVKCGAPVQRALPERGLLSRMVSRRVKCLDCGTIGAPRKRGWDLGSVLILFILLLCFFVPGLVYLIYRSRVANQWLCRKCSGQRMIDV